MSRFYVTNAIPYVNGDPHLGHALEFVQADVLARHRRLRGDEVRYLTGTDDNAQKNALAARAAGLPVGEFVARKAARFAALREPLELSYDDEIHTGSDPRHRPGVERLWRACAAAGDLYERDYEGLLCIGCEAFVDPAELENGRCPEHGTVPEEVRERNWFFRLSRHAEALRTLLESDALRVEPPERRNELLALLDAGLRDVSVSRSRRRAAGIGIPVPGDPEQVVYVWFDALANYVTALCYGGEEAPFQRWWRAADERVHVVGKGIARFHALLWPAILLSAGERPPSAVLVHGYLTANGRKISKSHGPAPDPAALVGRCGTDGLRWWLLRDVPPGGDADFREESLARRANELADGLGNLVNRTVALVARSSAWPLGPAPRELEPELRHGLAALPGAIDAALERFDFRAAAAALWALVDEANRFVSRARPWELAGHPARAGELEAVLALLLECCGTLVSELEPFLPGAAGRLATVLERRDPTLGRRAFAKVASTSRA